MYLLLPIVRYLSRRPPKPLSRLTHPVDVLLDVVVFDEIPAIFPSFLDLISVFRGTSLPPKEAGSSEVRDINTLARVVFQGWPRRKGVIGEVGRIIPNRRPGGISSEVPRHSGRPWRHKEKGQKGNGRKGKHVNC